MPDGIYKYVRRRAAVKFVIAVAAHEGRLRLTCYQCRTDLARLEQYVRLHVRCIDLRDAVVIKVGGIDLSSEILVDGEDTLLLVEINVLRRGFGNLPFGIVKRVFVDAVVDVERRVGRYIFEGDGALANLDHNIVIRRLRRVARAVDQMNDIRRLISVNRIVTVARAVPNRLFKTVEPNLIVALSSVDRDTPTVRFESVIARAAHEHRICTDVGIVVDHVIAVETFDRHVRILSVKNVIALRPHDPLVINLDWLFELVMVIDDVEGETRRILERDLAAADGGHDILTHNGSVLRQSVNQHNVCLIVMTDHHIAVALGIFENGVGADGNRIIALAGIDRRMPDEIDDHIIALAAAERRVTALQNVTVIVHNAIDFSKCDELIIRINDGVFAFAGVDCRIRADVGD